MKRATLSSNASVHVTRNTMFATVRSNRDARAWLTACLEFIGSGFHPDTPANQYIIVAYRSNRVVGKTFTSEECVAFERARNNVFRLLDDPYEFCINALDNAKRKDIRK